MDGSRERVEGGGRLQASSKPWKRSDMFDSTAVVMQQGTSDRAPRCRPESERAFLTR